MTILVQACTLFTCVFNTEKLYDGLELVLRSGSDKKPTNSAVLFRNCAARIANCAQHIFPGGVQFLSDDFLYSAEKSAE